MSLTPSTRSKIPVRVSLVTPTGTFLSVADAALLPGFMIVRVKLSVPVLVVLDPLTSSPLNSFCSKSAFLLWGTLIKWVKLLS